MLIKKSILCEHCKSYIDFYINEYHPMEDITMKCKCGHNQNYNTFYDS